MGGKSAILTIKIISDATKAAQGFDQTESKAKSWEASLSRASAVAATALAAAGAAAFKMGQAAAEDAQQQAVLAQSMVNAAGASKKQIAATEDWIDAQARATGIADDQLRPAMGSLVRATGDVAASQAALKVAMDVSTATGKPLQSVTEAMAKAYAGNTASLGKLVPGMDKAILASGDMNAIMAELARTTEGSAAAAADSAAGKWERAKLAFSETAESLGGVLLPIMASAATKAAALAGFIDNNRTAVIGVVSVLGTFAAIVLAINTAVKVATAVQAAWNVAMSLNPVGLIVLAVIALIAALVLAYQKSETFREIVQDVGRVGQEAIGWVVDKAGDLVGWFKNDVPAALNTAKDVAVTAFDAYTTPIQWVIDKVEDLVGWIDRIDFPDPPGWVKNIGSKFGLGGPPPGVAGAGHRRGGAGYAASSYGGAGGAGTDPFMLPMGGGRTVYAGGDTIIINGALDPVAVADQLDRLRRRRRVRKGVTT